MSEKGRVDFNYMSDLTDKDKNTLIDELKGEIYLDIKDYDESNNTLPFSSSMDEESMSFRYVPADEYLSGNIRKKLKTINKYINAIL